jgi:hypothetical protein
MVTVVKPVTADGAMAAYMSAAGAMAVMAAAAARRQPERLSRWCPGKIIVLSSGDIRRTQLSQTQVPVHRS